MADLWMNLYRWIFGYHFQSMVTKDLIYICVKILIKQEDKKCSNTSKLLKGFIHQKILKYVSCLSYNLLDWLLYECTFNVLLQY